MNGRTIKSRFADALSKLIEEIKQFKETSVRIKLQDKVTLLERSLSHITGHGDDHAYATLDTGISTLREKIAALKRLDLAEAGINKITDEKKSASFHSRADAIRENILGSEFNSENTKKAITELNRNVMDFRTGPIPLAPVITVVTPTDEKKSSLGIFACLFPCCGGSDSEEEKEVRQPLLRTNPSIQ